MANFIINVDLEYKNEWGAGPDNCPSEMHKGLGPHYDITVHVLGCGCLNKRSVNRPPDREWFTNNGVGYTLSEVVKKVERLISLHGNAYARRCTRRKKDGVPEHRPLWD